MDIFLGILLGQAHVIGLSLGLRPLSIFLKRDEEDKVGID